LDVGFSEIFILTDLKSPLQNQDFKGKTFLLLVINNEERKKFINSELFPRIILASELLAAILKIKQDSRIT